MGGILLIIVAVILAANGNYTLFWIFGGIAALALVCAASGKGGGKAVSRERPRIRIDHPHAISDDEYECTVCGRRFSADTMVCPHCGVRFTESKTDYEEFDGEEDELEAWDEEEGW